MGRVERNVGAARFQYAEDADDHHGVVVQQQGYPRTFLAHDRRDRRRDSIGRAIERRVAPLPSLLFDGETPRTPLHMLCESLWNGPFDLVLVG